MAGPERVWKRRIKKGALKPDDSNAPFCFSANQQKNGIVTGKEWMGLRQD
jgi:hypothetical protein